MPRLLPWMIALLWMQVSLGEELGQGLPNTQAVTPLSISELDRTLDQKEVTIKFVVSELGGVAQLHIPGKALSFVIETMPQVDRKNLRVWIEGDLADRLDQMGLSFYGDKPLSKGTVIIGTGTLSFSPGVGDSQGHEWYELKLNKVQSFRIEEPHHSLEDQALLEDRMPQKNQLNAMGRQEKLSASTRQLSATFIGGRPSRCAKADNCDLRVLCVRKFQMVQFRHR